MIVESLIDAITMNQYIDVAFILGGWIIVILFIGFIIFAIFMVIKEKNKELKDIELKYKLSHIDITAGDEGVD